MQRSGDLSEMIGRYAVITKLQVSGIWNSYLARDLELNRTIEIRVAESEVLNPWVLNEARVLASLQHPEIVPVYDAGMSGELAYFTTEYNSRSLASDLDNPPIAISREGIGEGFSRIAIALDHVHRRGYIHRDVKPFSILIDASGRLRLSGFSIAIVPNNRLEKDGVVVGTPAYMSPEQVLNRPLGPQTDVWGLGATLYEALCLKEPFGSLDEDNMSTRLFDRILKLQPRDPREIDGTIPDGLAQICLRCLEKDLARRYVDCQSIAEDLDIWAQGKLKRSLGRVFISHSSLDREFVETNIVSVLESNGIPTWYSKASIQTAAEWERSIVDGLKSCNWFLVVVSQNSICSEWVKDELFWAIDQRSEHIIPVRIDEREPSELHIRLARKQAIDLHTNSQAGMPALLSLLGQQMP